MSRTQSFDANPEDFFQEDKVLVPMRNLSALEAVDIKEDEDCSICQLTVHAAEGQRAYILPSCGHAFHADAEKCLGEGSILTWLRDNNTCPNCKVVVEVCHRN